jgi:hypothetical protein
LGAWHCSIRRTRIPGTRDALNIGEAARTLTPEASMTLDLGTIHPLTGPV